MLMGRPGSPVLAMSNVGKLESARPSYSYSSGIAEEEEEEELLSKRKPGGSHQAGSSIVHADSCKAASQGSRLHEEAPRGQLASFGEFWAVNCVGRCEAAKRQRLLARVRMRCEADSGDEDQSQRARW